MPPMPPGGIGGVFSFSGISVTNASVVSNRPAMDAAFCSALRVTFVAFALLHFFDNERAFCASVIGKLTRRLFNGAAHDLHADFLVGLKVLHVIERFLRAQECYTAAWDDAFLNRRTRGVQRVLDASFLLFHLGLGCSADIDDRNAAGEFRQSL